jgi:predicted lipoprotein with Yx(FWY)xxD motif
MRILIALATAVTTVATVAFAQMAPTKTGDSAKGKVLTNDKGMTLYVFDKDSSGKSACNGPCAGNWPPLMAAVGAIAADRTRPSTITLDCQSGDQA